ncbi:hypothetical protein GCM10010309_63090 [Streptomyces violaceochromogenes]|nr:hypothetical protein GCM10010309_63090 [Streptomyces violaceochromogenes]
MTEVAVAAPVAAISPSALRRSMEGTSYSIGGGKGATAGGVVAEARFQETASAQGVAGRAYGGTSSTPHPHGDVRRRSVEVTTYRRPPDIIRVVRMTLIS